MIDGVSASFAAGSVQSLHHKLQPRSRLRPHGCPPGQRGADHAAIRCLSMSMTRRRCRLGGWSCVFLVTPRSKEHKARSARRPWRL